jgi:hypothetical protein
MKLDINNPKPGIYTDVDFATYLKIKAVNNGWLGDLKDCPAKTQVEDEDTKPMKGGRLIHALVLEGEEVINQRYVVGPDINKNTTKYKGFVAAAQLNGLEVISQKELDAARAVNMAVMTHPAAALLLAQGIVETTIIWKDERTGLLCKARPDALPDPSKRTLIDLKSSHSADPKSFVRRILDFGYDRAAVHYMSGMNTITDHNYDIYVFVVVEPKPPHRVGVYTLDSFFIGHGETERERLMDLELLCKTSGIYPHYTPDPHTGLWITEIELPGYVI